MNHPLMASIKEIEFLQSRIAEKNARIAALEAALRTHQLHAGDVHSLNGEVDMWRERALEAADRIEVLEAALREAVKIAGDFDCHLAGYPNEEARSFYESGVIDASTMIAERIAALAPEQDMRRK